MLLRKADSCHICYVYLALAKGVSVAITYKLPAPSLLDCGL